MVALLIEVLIWYLLVFTVCLCLAYLSLCMPCVGPSYIGSTLPGRNISLRDRENISLWEREMVGLLIIFVIVYLCVFTVFLCLAYIYSFDISWS